MKPGATGGRYTLVQASLVAAGSSAAPSTLKRPTESE
eukprot:CAMPEP_0206018020 /NCGR_PEP_ID=MMETSP1464-20131121/26250_1 /ASSEMBLY_ACC=CAM_ASM_001124 /TAXON_ID=119497 /ORGANISM="Exanthemachrysis gayraliae, Strain RCC1523" /LENGTH=36 /DNA_ID= /DNA_START= /DNA_END= /DNA_ORIENTATION=